MRLTQRGMTVVLLIVFFSSLVLIAAPMVQHNIAEAQRYSGGVGDNTIGNNDDGDIGDLTQGTILKPTPVYAAPLESTIIRDVVLEVGQTFFIVETRPDWVKIRIGTVEVWIPEDTISL